MTVVEVGYRLRPNEVKSLSLLLRAWPTEGMAWPDCGFARSSAESQRYCLSLQETRFVSSKFSDVQSGTAVLEVHCVTSTRRMALQYNHRSELLHHSRSEALAERNGEAHLCMHSYQALLSPSHVFLQLRVGPDSSSTAWK